MKSAPGLLSQDDLPLLHQLHQPLQGVLDGLHPPPSLYLPAPLQGICFNATWSEATHLLLR